MRVTRHLVLAFVLSCALADTSPASAGWVNELGRNLGVGWSDGYHAYEGCPDKRLHSQPWQRRTNRGVREEHLVPYLEPVPTPAPSPAPESLPPPQSSRAKSPQLHISRPNY